MKNLICNQPLFFLFILWGIFPVLGHSQERVTPNPTRPSAADNAYITQLLNGSRNMTLRTLSDIAFALDVEPRFEIGFRDQLCQEPHWDTFVKPNVRITRKVLCGAFGNDERSLSGEWVDACVEERAA